MLRIAVVEDDVEDRNTIKTYLKQVAESENVQYEISEFANGFSFLDDYGAGFDIVFMDIDMPGIDGISVAKQLRMIDENAILIFVTNMAQLAIKGYEVAAMDFIVKPINKYNFAMKMSKIFIRAASLLKETIRIRMDGETHNVNVSSIKFLEMDAHFVIYHCTDRDYREYITFKEAEKKINKPFFGKCNRCYLINYNYIESVNKNCVVIDGRELIISRPQKKEFLNGLADFYAGRKSK